MKISRIERAGPLAGSLSPHQLAGLGGSPPDLLAAALAVSLERPLSNVTLAEVARRAGVSEARVTRQFPNASRIFRAAASKLVRDIAEELEDGPDSGQGEKDRVRGYAAFLARIVDGERYEQLIYLLLRDGRAQPWLRDLYETRIVARVDTGLLEALWTRGFYFASAAEHEAKPGARLLAALEAELVLPKLLPGYSRPPAAELRSAIDSIASALIAERLAPHEIAQ